MPLPAMKCIVRDCTNLDSEGVFVGYLCAPCYQALRTGGTSTGLASMYSDHSIEKRLIDATYKCETAIFRAIELANKEFTQSVGLQISDIAIKWQELHLIGGRIQNIPVSVTVVSDLGK